MKSFPDHRRAGFTLTEIAIVLGVVGLVIAGVWTVASQVRINDRVRTANRQLIAIAQNIRTVFAEQGGVTSNAAATLTQALDQLRAFPLEMRQTESSASGVIFHPWDQTVGGGLGSVRIYATDCAGIQHTSSSDPPQPCFEVDYVNVPQLECTRILLPTSQPNSGLQLVQVNNTDIADAKGTSGVFPISASNAAAACNAANNEIDWIYLLRDNG